MADALLAAHIPCEVVNKVQEGSPNVVDMMAEGTIQLVVNTTQGAKSIRDSYAIRRNALLSNIPYFTTMAAALGATAALEARELNKGQAVQVRSLQEWHRRSLESVQG